MRRGRYRGPRGRVAFAHVQLWLAAALAFVVVDVAATAAGFGLGVVLGAGPVASPLLETYGPRALVGAKLGVLVGCYALWRGLPRPYRTAGPVGLALLGLVLAGWRLQVVASTLVG